VVTEIDNSPPSSTSRGVSVVFPAEGEERIRISRGGPTRVCGRRSSHLLPSGSARGTARSPLRSSPIRERVTSPALAHRVVGLAPELLGRKSRRRPTAACGEQSPGAATWARRRSSSSDSRGWRGITPPGAGGRVERRASRRRRHLRLHPGAHRLRAAGGLSSAARTRDRRRRSWRRHTESAAPPAAGLTRAAIIRRLPPEEAASGRRSWPPTSAPSSSTSTTPRTRAARRGRRAHASGRRTRLQRAKGERPPVHPDRARRRHPRW
jgi:hypothetical protein